MTDSIVDYFVLPRDIEPESKVDEIAINLLLDCVKIIRERRIAYGDTLQSMNLISDRWTRSLGVMIAPDQVADMMAELKACRLENDPDHQDSVMDQINYLAIAWAIRLASRESSSG